jgi:hypothetical protein
VITTTCDDVYGVAAPSSGLGSFCRLWLICCIENSELRDNATDPSATTLPDMAIVGRAARYCIRQSSNLNLSQSLRPGRKTRFAQASRSLSTSQQRTAKLATSYNRNPANGNGNAAPTPTAPKAPSIDDQSSIQDLSSGLADEPLILDEGSRQVDWTRSFHGLSAQPFSKEAADVLLAEIPFDDVEVKPDGIIYLPEIKYRRILNKAFGPGGWGLAPRGETIVTPKSITREYALVAHGRYIIVLLLK